MIKYSPSTNGFYFDEFIPNEIPKDLIELSDEEYKNLYLGLSEGKIISLDEKTNKLKLSEPSQKSEDELIKFEILKLEYSITQRRLREAILGVDNGWLADVESKIAALREKL